MKHEPTKLIGFYNPFGEFPSTVVPVFRALNSGLFATYISKDKESIEPVPLAEDFPFMSLSDESRLGLEYFDPVLHRMFAYASDNIGFYAVKDQENFYGNLLRTEKALHTNPFIYLSFIERSGDRNRILKGFLACLSLLMNKSPKFAQSWYEGKRDSIRGLHLPERVEDFLAQCHEVSIAYSSDKEELVLALCSLFNTSEAEPSIGIPIVLFAKRITTDTIRGIGTAPAGLLCPESEETANQILSGYTYSSLFLGSSDLVIAIDPAFLQRYQHVDSTDIVTFFRSVASVDDFSWIHARSRLDINIEERSDYRRLAVTDEIARLTTRAIGTIAYEVAKGDDYLIGKMLASMEDKVQRYFETDTEAVSYAIRNGRWQVSAFMAQSHVVARAATGLPETCRPVIIRLPEAFDNSPRIGINHVIITLSEDAETSHVRELLTDIIEKDIGQRLIQQSGLSLVRSVTASEVIEKQPLSVVAERLASYSKALAVSLVIDTSGSMGGTKIEMAKGAFWAFLSSLDINRGDSFSVVQFDSNANVLVPLTPVRNSTERTVQALSEIKASGMTALFDAVMLGVGQVANRLREIAVVILLTDGHENASTSSIDELMRTLTEARANGVHIFTLAYGEDADYGLLEDISSRTLGASMRGTPENIRRILEEIHRTL